jgi:large subunit ribosomal protein L24
MGVKIKKGDMVEVIAGEDKGKRGKVLRVVAEKERAVVEKVNMVKRHMKPTQTSKGGIVEKEAGLHLSNMGVVCSTCDKPVRMKAKIAKDGTKSRVCAKCGEVLDKK